MAALALPLTLLAPSWRYQCCLGCLGMPLHALALSCASFGPSPNNPVSFLELCTASGRLGSVLDNLGPIFGLSRIILCLSWAVLGPSWAVFALSWAEA